MKKGPAIALAALVVLPTAFSLWMGWRTLRDDRSRIHDALARSMASRLESLSLETDRFVSASAADLAARLGENPGAETLGELSRRDEMILQAFAIQAGALVYPPKEGASESEKAFMERIAPVLAEGSPDRAVGQEGREVKPGQGWITWFHGGGQRFAFWIASAETSIAGAELNPSAFLARLAAALPDAGDERTFAEDELIVLMDARGRDFMRWGGLEPAPSEQPLAALRLGSPLQGWEFRAYGGLGAGKGLAAAETWLLAAGGLTLAAAIGSAALLLVRGLAREMAEARQRVSFVNQVSHELKTPLTNIRLYLDLLRARLGGGAGPAEECLDVIGAESQRLTRLIHNVLSFARKEGREAPRPEEADWDETVAAALECFRPSFAAKGLVLEFAPGGVGRYAFDQDWARQIVGNLVSNAEKYAAGGGLVRVETGAGPSGPWARVSDRGPGIPAKDRQRVFEPFVRLSDALTEGVSGSGLGLSISRRLARAHGGDIVLEDCAEGASFLLSLAAERIST
jgi:signal transduction histidine kinase